MSEHAFADVRRASSRRLSARTDFRWPLGEVHAGIPLGNGTLGVLVWGGRRTLHLTINRGDYWDHRGGLEFGPEATYANLRAWLEAGDETRIREVFEGEGRAPAGVPARPTRLPMGRLDLELPADWSIIGAGLTLQRGEAEIDLERRGASAKLRATVLRHANVLTLRLTGMPGHELQIRPRPPDTPVVREYRRDYGVPEPELFDLDEFAGWTQQWPGESALCVGWMRHATQGGLGLYVTAAYGSGPGEARREAMRVLDAVRGQGYTSATLASFTAWGHWWDRTPSVALPDAGIEQLFEMGMYRLGALTGPAAPPIALQGPWVEDHRFPPWSGDYHFNINVQECYWPCLAGNHPESIDTLAEMLMEWIPRLRRNARAFLGVEDALFLPHSTDDRGTAMTGFWSGFVDLGCAGWISHLFWQRYRWTGDTEFLARVAYPWLKGSLSAYRAALQSDDAGLSLPVSVSPEYGGRGRGAWGRNASFQLAIVHFLCQSLREASEILGVDVKERASWAEVDRLLPLGAVDGTPELLLWEGQPLCESHRHHSHLAAIYPFDLLDTLGSEAHRRLAANSLRRWTRMGMGQWTGWCLPWAAIIHARQGNGEMASLLLEMLRRLFQTAGFATTHDARAAGLTVMDARPDVMQLDAGLGAAAAVMECLVHTSQGVLRLFPAVPPSWRQTAFTGIRAEGGVLVSALRENGQLVEATLEPTVDVGIRLLNPCPGTVVIQTGGLPPSRSQQRIIALELRGGERVVLTPAS